MHNLSRTHCSPLIIDIHGTKLTTIDKQRLLHPLVGGVILFTRNWVDRAQLTQLCADIKAVRSDMLICVDHEGGRVQRFKTDGFTHIPPMRNLGKLWEHDVFAACQAATATGYILGAELRACGVDFTFAPCLDIDYGRASVIGTRAFSNDWRVITMLARNVILGLLQSGMQNCGKHFPGHGYAIADTHTSIARDTRSFQAIKQQDLNIYAQLVDVLAAIMPGHVIYPKIDNQSACFSRHWLDKVLRQQLHFAGAIFSDDLSMQAARQIENQTIGFAQAAMRALNAGCDFAVLCNQSIVSNSQKKNNTLDLYLEDMVQGLKDSLWQLNPSSEIKRLNLLTQTMPLPWEQLMSDPRYRQALDHLFSDTSIGNRYGR